MGFRIIAGRAGSGKTMRCLNEIINKAPHLTMSEQLILLVPEQSTFQYEQALLAHKGLNGTCNIQVLSFRRLAWRVFQETGGIARSEINETGRRMLLHSIVEQYKQQLRIYGRHSGRTGFYDELMQIMSEFKRYCLRPDDLLQAADNSASPILNAKLCDLQMLFSAFDQKIAEQYTDPEDVLDLLAQKAEQSLLISNAEIWIDGFSGFTPQEIQVLRALILNCRQVTVALCLDCALLDQNVSKSNLFYLTAETWQELCELSDNCRVPITEIVRLDNPDKTENTRFADEHMLAWLEHNIFARRASFENNYDACRSIADYKPAVRMLAAVNRRAEAEACARGILTLVYEQGLHWRDCVIIVRDSKIWREELTNVLEQYNIPYFLDGGQTVLHHPLLALVRSALDCASDNCRYSSLFDYFKNDLQLLSRDDIDRLENYFLEKGIQGKNCLSASPWLIDEQNNHYTDGTQRSLDEIRREVSFPLRNFIDALAEDTNILMISEAIWQLLSDIHAEETMLKWIREAEDKGDLLKAHEQKAIWNGMIRVLEQMTQIFGEQHCSVSQYSDLLLSGLSDLRPGRVPSTLDQVLIAEIERSRTPEVKAAFVLGINEGQFPAPNNNGSLLNETERKYLENTGLKLAPGNQERALHEQFLFYIAMTRASRWLTISYSLGDEEGHALNPSLYWYHLRALMESFGVREELVSSEPDSCQEEQLGWILSKNKHQTVLMQQLGHWINSGELIAPVWWSLYNDYVTDPQKIISIKKRGKSLFFDNNEYKLLPEISRLIYGSPLWLSVSQLERYNNCHFAFFLARGLRLKERKKNTLAAPDLGQLFHEILRELEMELLAEGKQAGDLTAEELNKHVDKAVDDQLPLLQNNLLFSNERYIYLNHKLRDIMYYVASLLAEHDRRGEFKLKEVELDFGSHDGLPTREIFLTNGETLKLRGRIDRLDIAQKDEITWLRIIDYKSGAAELKLKDIYNGQKLQLLMYLSLAVEMYNRCIDHGIVMPAAMLYFPVKKPLFNCKLPVSKENAEQERRKKMRLNGFTYLPPELLSMLDYKLSESGKSDLVNFSLTAKGEPSKKSGIFTQRQWQLLDHHLNRILENSGRDISEGHIEIEPKRSGKEVPCRYCEFKTVCCFDPRLGNKYHFAANLTDDQIWDKLEFASGSERK